MVDITAQLRTECSKQKRRSEQYMAKPPAAWVTGYRRVIRDDQVMTV